MSKSDSAGSRPDRTWASIAIAILLSVPVCAVVAAAAVPKSTPPPFDLKLPPDILYNHPVHADSSVTFSHLTHVDYESYRCTGCHPRLYRLLTPRHKETHREMDQGASCGTCHDGKHAFDVRATQSCGSCHAGRRSAGSDSTGKGGFTGPKPFVFKMGSDSPGRVTFKHDTHLGKSMTCRTCHPSPFSMRSHAPLPDGEMHSPSACGKCHDGKQSFSCEDDNKCEKCHVE